MFNPGISFMANVTTAKNLSQILPYDQMKGVNAFCDEIEEDSNQVDVEIKKLWGRQVLKLTTSGKAEDTEHSDKIKLYEKVSHTDDIERIYRPITTTKTKLLTGKKIQEKLTEVYNNHVNIIAEQTKIIDRS